MTTDDRTDRTAPGAAASWHALDFAAAVLAADPEGRARAREALLRDPGASIDAFGTLLLGLAGADTRQVVEHMLAMGSLHELDSP